MQEMNSQTSLITRLSSLIPKGKDTALLANYLGCSVQAINQYKNGTAYPKTENLIKIANYCNCSLDYLCGLTDCPSYSATVQSVCNCTGLSVGTVLALNEVASHNKKKLVCIENVINTIVGSDI